MSVQRVKYVLNNRLFKRAKDRYLIVYAHSTTTVIIIRAKRKEGCLGRWGGGGGGKIS